jgi:hypothetical protein
MNQTNNQASSVTGNSGMKKLKSESESQKPQPKKPQTPQNKKENKEVEKKGPSDDLFKIESERKKPAFNPPADIEGAKKKEPEVESEPQGDPLPEDTTVLDVETQEQQQNSGGKRVIQIGALGKIMIKTVSASGNSQKALAIVRKVEEAYNKDNQILVDLCLLPPNMWNLIGKTQEQTNALTQSVLTKKTSSNKNASRLYNQEIERVNSLKNKIKIPSTSADYLTIGNLLKNSISLKNGYDELRAYVKCVGIPVGEGTYNLSLFHCQNLWKGYKFEDFKAINMVRYRAILIGVHTNWENYEPDPVTEMFTLDNPEDFQEYDPRAWMTWVNPRFATKCVDSREVNGAPKSEVLEWVYSVEASMAKAMKVNVDLSTRRIEKFEANVITTWWGQVSAGYKALNKMILKSKGVKDIGIKYTKWNEVKVNEPLSTIFDT